MNSRMVSCTVQSHCVSRWAVATRYRMGFLVCSPSWPCTGARPAPANTRRAAIQERLLMSSPPESRIVAFGGIAAVLIEAYDSEIMRRPLTRGAYAVQMANWFGADLGGRRPAPRGRRP